MSETVINTGTNGYSHLVLVESADANSASKLFLALTNKNEGRFVRYQNYTNSEIKVGLS